MSTFDQVKKIIVDCTGASADLIKPEAVLDEDVGLDSLDTVDIVMAAEEHFGVEIPDEAIAVVMTVQDAVNAVDEALAARGRAA